MQFVIPFIHCYLIIFQFTLLGNYPSSPFALNLFCSTLIVVGLIQVLFIVHGFRNPHMLSDHVTQNGSSLVSEGGISKKKSEEKGDQNEQRRR